MMKVWLNLLTRKQLTGFTLTELLIASVMAFFVVSAAGFAILVMTRQNLVNHVSSDLTYNTHRASEFIASEIKRAKGIEISKIETPPPILSDCPDFTAAEDEFVMGLVVDTPEFSNATTSTIIYYSKTPPDQDLWRGPSSIYRCGPSLESDGNFGSAGNEPSILVDSILAPLPSPNPSPCPSDTTTSSPTDPAAGFYICQDNNNPKLIEIHITATSSDLENRGLTRSGDAASSGTYKVVTKAFARATATP
jgi:hypothetical protein